MEYEPIFPFVPSVIFPLMALTFCAVIIWLVFKAAARQRTMLHQERIAALKEGVELPPEAFLDHRQRRARNWLRTGMVEGAVGGGLVAALLVCCPDSRLWAWGLPVILLGIAHLIFWRIRGYREWEEERALAHELRMNHRQDRHTNGGENGEAR